jgi:hypothetical protein
MALEKCDKPPFEEPPAEVTVWTILPFTAAGDATNRIWWDLYKKCLSRNAAKTAAEQAATAAAAAQAAQEQFVNGVGSSTSNNGAGNNKNTENKNGTTDKAEPKLTDNPLFWVLIGILILGLGYKAFAKPVAATA